MGEFNFGAVLAAALSAFVLGGFWYSTKVFGRKWNREVGMREIYKKNGHGPFVFTIAFLMSLLAASAFAMFLGPQPTLTHAMTYALMVGVGWVFSSFTINYLFAGRSHKLLLIDGSYHVVQFLLYGLILALWPF